RVFQVTGVQTCALPIYWEGGDGEKLDVVLSGSGDLDLKGNFRTANITVSGSGDLEAKGFRVREGVQVSVQGSGDVTLEGGAQSRSDERRVGKSCCSGAS